MRVRIKPDGMGYVCDGGSVGSRRAFLLSWPALRLAGASRRGTTYPSEAETYIDEAAEFEVTRFTDPSFASWLPGGRCRFISSREEFLIYSSERSGSLQAFRLELATGRHRQLTEARALDPSSLALLDNDSAFVYIDGTDLFRASTSGGRPAPVYSPGEGAGLGYGLATGDGDTAALVERGHGGARILVLELRRGRTVAVLDRMDPVGDLLPRPGNNALTFRSGGGLWLAEYSGGEPRPLPAAPGSVGPALWDSGGASLYYLRLIGESGRGNQLREFRPESGEDVLVTEASGIVGFAVNSIGTVFAGIRNRESGSGVVLLLRTGSELALCEHGASEPERVAVSFSPDGQRLYFEGDRDGSSAVYSVSLEGLVEPTPI